MGKCECLLYMIDEWKIGLRFSLPINIQYIYIFCPLVCQSFHKSTYIIIIGFVLLFFYFSSLSLHCLFVICIFCLWFQTASLLIDVVVLVLVEMHLYNFLVLYFALHFYTIYTIQSTRRFTFFPLFSSEVKDRQKRSF